MFAKTIIDSDAFLDMPLSTQALYFHLSMRADDEGFLNNANKVMRVIGANQNDYDILLSKRFIIQFPDGICVIKHWRIHNWIRGDRKKDTIYQQEREMLDVKQNGAYTLVDSHLVDTCQTVDGQNADGCQHSIGKDSIGKDSIGDTYSSDISDSPAVNSASKTKKINKKNADALFEVLWAMYPNKRGKGSVSETKKLALLKIGKEEMERAIKRYLAEQEQMTWRKTKNGSTFFNSGYVDYLDANYVPAEVESLEKQNPNNQFNNFKQRDYSMAYINDLEQRLLNR